MSSTSQPLGGTAGQPDPYRRGLTARGAVLLVLVLGGAGAAVDVVTASSLGTAFAICFVAACALSAFVVHREDLVAAVVLPPLVYAVIALVAGAFSHTTATGSWLARQALEVVSAVVLGAPVLLAATGVALVIALVRGLTGRRRT